MPMFVIGERTFVLSYGLEKCRSFQLSNKSKPGKSRSLSHSPHRFQEKGVELNAFTQLKAFDCRNQANTNNPRPKKVSRNLAKKPYC